MAIKFGLFVPQGWRMDLAEIADPVEKYEAMTGAARAADAEEGWDSVWVFDHFHTVPTPELEATFECWTVTSTLASVHKCKSTNQRALLPCTSSRRWR